MQSAKFIPTLPPQLSNDIDYVQVSSWQNVLRHPARGLALVYGAPGVGKTTLLAKRFKQLVLEQGLRPESILVLTASRESATSLRDRLLFELAESPNQASGESEAVAVEGALARTISSLAFSIVRRNALANQEVQPELISGSEQDAVLQRLLAGPAGAAAEAIWPIQIGSATRQLAGFRAELRDLIASCQEQGVDSNQLSRLASGSAGLPARPEWQASSLIFQAYEQWLSEPQNLNRFDSAGLVNRAVALFQDSVGESPFDVILIDDAQELTPSAARLVAAMTTKYVGLYCFGDPDSGTLGFRQASPGLMAELVSHLATLQGRESHTFVLQEDPWGKPLGVGKVQAKVSALIGVVGSGKQRSVHAAAQTNQNSGSNAITAKVFSSQQAEIEWLSYQLRQAHLHEGVAWNQMAVVARTRKQLDALERALSAQSVPVRIAGAQQALRDEFASRELLELAAFISNDAPITIQAVDRLLRSPFCGLDSLGIRRLRRALRREELSAETAANVARNSDELLLELFTSPAAAETLRGPEAAKLRAFLKTIQKCRHTVESGEASIEDLLWQIWQPSGLAKSWGDAARGVGEVAAQANRNLDAIVALFAAANRFVERNPGKPAQMFLEQQLEQVLPEDSLVLGTRNQRHVILLTPAAVVGRRFDVVAIPQLIEGVWPNLKPRNSLLSANLVASTLSTVANGSVAAQALPRQELSDELRMFYKAVGAANARVLVSSYADPDEQVSQFLAHVTGGEIPQEEDFGLPALTLRGLAGNLRRRLAVETDEQAQARIAVDLGRLASAGVAGAHPDDWYGLAEISTSEPLFEFLSSQPDTLANDAAATDSGFKDQGQHITINPSQLEAFLKCPLHWFLNYHGAAGSDFSASVGTLVHRALELTTSASETELWAHVEAGWHSLEFETEWLEQAERRRAQKLIANLSKYLSEFDASGATVLAKEQPFEFELGQALVRGKVDRIECTSDGTIVIVDLKTGKSIPSKDEAEVNPQLGLYQLAYEANAYGSDVTSKGSSLGGAKLLLVSGENSTIRNQSSIDGNESLQALFKGMVANAAEGMAMPDNVFIANVSSHCDAENEFGTCRIHLTRAVSYGE